MLAVGAADLDTFAALCARELLPLRRARSSRHRRRPAGRRRSPLLEPAHRAAAGDPAGAAAAHDARRAPRRHRHAAVLASAGLNIREAALRLLRLPTVADKTFLVTIGDRTVGGLIARDQMVGPWQVPVADRAGVTCVLASTPSRARRWRWASGRHWRCWTPPPRRAWPSPRRSRTSPRRPWRGSRT